MGKLLEEFIAQFDNDASNVDLSGLMSDEERIEWETLVKVYNDIEIVDIANTVKKIPKVYKLNRNQDLAVLAYIKVLEMMVRVARDSMGIEGMPPNFTKPSSSDYDGSMFG